MPERNYMSHSSEDRTGMHTNRTIKYGMGVSVEIRSDTAKQYNKYENKQRKYLKALKKQNKIIYRISKKSGSRREIKKIKAKASKKSLTL